MNVEKDEHVRSLIDKMPKASYIDTKIAMYDVYETVFGIYDHMVKREGIYAKPLASVALHESESVCEGSDLYLTMEKFMKLDIYKFTGLNMTEFLKLPREFVSLIFKHAEGITEKDTQDKEKVLAGLAAAAGSKK